MKLNKHVMFLGCAMLVFTQAANAVKLVLTNNATFVIAVFPDFEWSTTEVNQGEKKPVLERNDDPLSAFTAFEKGNTSRTVKKYQLKKDLVDKFNNLQHDNAARDKEMHVEFPDDFDVEVSLRLRR